MWYDIYILSVAGLNGDDLFSELMPEYYFSLLTPSDN